MSRRPKWNPQVWNKGFLWSMEKKGGQRVQEGGERGKHHELEDDLMESSIESYRSRLKQDVGSRARRGEKVLCSEN